ncbi:MAG TPA: hypothetical protein VM821_03600 [Abditibacteriaceae bacterium]|jgi:RNase H-fold protein (predicted Holliday junction resolvase)|nr:hypothetical protein [Abditibacteriaceae bacterium]
MSREVVNEAGKDEQGNNETFLTAAVIIAIDPGRDKCGVAVVQIVDNRVLERRIVPRATVLEFLQTSLARFPDAVLVLGNATTSRALREDIARLFPRTTIQMQDETGSTLEARDLYWTENAPCGWRRLWPRSLQMPPEPIDDFAAVVLAQRFLATKSND